MARIVPYAAIQFSAHEHWKNWLGVDKRGQKWVRLYLALGYSIRRQQPGDTHARFARLS